MSTPMTLMIASPGGQQDCVCAVLPNRVPYSPSICNTPSSPACSSPTAPFLFSIHNVFSLSLQPPIHLTLKRMVSILLQSSSYGESISTLGFGSRVSEITLGQAKKNSESAQIFEAKDQMIRWACSLCFGPQNICWIQQLHVAHAHQFRHVMMQICPFYQGASTPAVSSKQPCRPGHANANQRPM